MNSITETIRKKIDETGMKQKAIAEKIGIEATTLSAILNGRRKMYATDFIKLCCVLGLSIDYFIM